MRAPRFYCDLPLTAGTRLILPEHVAHHALRVLRLRAGASMVIFNGQGGEYPARLQLEGKTALAQLGAFHPREAELAGLITLVQGLPTGARLEKRLLHWRRVAQAASEQCGRNRLMVVETPTTLPEWLTRSQQELCLMCQPQAAKCLSEVLATPPAAPQLAIMVGPEGGWSDEEIAQAHRQGVEAVHHGNRVLRTETAGIVLLSAASTLLRWV